MIAKDYYDDREEIRGGARELDEATENLLGLTRAQRDLNRAYPRAMPAPITNTRLCRRLPAEIELRRSLSRRQRDARSATKNRVLSSMPAVRYEATRTLMGDKRVWEQTNSALSDVAGDAVELDDEQRKFVQRVDRGIQRYERNSGRGHVVYVSVSVPEKVLNPRDLPSTLHPGSVISFDRFTGATHSLHELDGTCQPSDVVFEIRTDRGMYVGSSGRGANSHHLMPRGIQLQVLGAHFAPYERPGQPPSERLIVQLVDFTPSPPSDAER